MSKVCRLNAFAYAKLQTIVMAFAGFIAGCLYAGLGMMNDLMTVGWNHGTSLAFLAIPVMPIYFAVFGFLAGIGGAFLYNFCATWIRLKIPKELAQSA